MSAAIGWLAALLAILTALVTLAVAIPDPHSAQPPVDDVVTTSYNDGYYDATLDACQQGLQAACDWFG